MPLFLILSVILIGMTSYNEALPAAPIHCLTATKTKNIDGPVRLDCKGAPHKLTPHSKSLAIISCSGKSGSTTLEASFKALGLETRRSHVIDNALYTFILDRFKDTNIILIDSMRDIISRKISSYFHKLPNHLQLSSEKIMAQYKKNRLKFLNFLQKNFNDKILKIAHHHGFNYWKQFNYDCLKDAAFNFEKKYQLKKIGNLYFINLRFDDIANWQEIIRSIPIPTDLKNFKIMTANQAKNKWYKEIYEDFLIHFTLSKADFDVILSEFSEEITHFYTKQEIKNFIKKWEPYLVD